MYKTVVRKPLVSQALHRLRQQPTHTLFAGYLCLQRQTGILNRLTDLKPDFRAFYQEFFSVKDHPLGAPYIKPFIEQKPSSKNLWLNGNVAGSYAPSSLRQGQPFRRVVDIQDGTYALSPNHATKAFENLLFSKAISAVDLAIFLYRDYGFEDNAFSVTELVDIFAYEFGYSSKPGAAPKEGFSLLYKVAAISDTREWFESVE